MMAVPLTLRVLTEAGVALEAPAVSVIVPGALGYLGVLAHHAPLVTTVRPGRLTWEEPGGARQSLDVQEGLFEVAHNRCTLLTRHVGTPQAQSTSRTV